ncbi:MAG: NAD-dependent epimerase/dehydratase family protein [Erythrobacter sp.]|nr:MAG: NAD-dependent epimerase/dehydratase family protein [Erythrobacter sp.]
MSVGAESTILVTGGAGFVGSNLADRLAARGHRVRVLDHLGRPGVESNLEWLCHSHGSLIEPVIGDIRDRATVTKAARGIGAAFHFAAQVAVTTSMEDPREDFAVNVVGTFNLLDSLRQQNSHAALIFASTNKVYGNLAGVPLYLTDRGYRASDPKIAEHGVPEDQPLCFHTPYGCSKGAADQYVLDYGRSFGMRTAVLRMSCIYGERQLGTEDQGWVAHFLIRALAGETITLFGDGEQVRDVCDVRDTCDAYLAMLDRIDAVQGRAFNWGGGAENAISLLGLIEEIARITGRRPAIEFADTRPGDQRWFVADTRKIDQALGLKPRTPWRDGVRNLADWLHQSRRAAAPALAPSARANA